MLRWSIVAACFLAPTVHAADEESAVALVIDGQSDRVPTHTVAPKYPRKARRDRIEGRVQVCFEIDRQGRPRRVAVRNSTHRAFEKPSIRAVRASIFRPLGKNEALQAIKSCRTFIFSLEPVESQRATSLRRETEASLSLVRVNHRC